MTMTLTILGSGSPESHPRRASSGYLLEIGSDRILFDCGGGVHDNLIRSGSFPSDLTHIVFSHLHSDHMMDYARLIHAAWDEAGKSPKVHGPAPIAEITGKLFGADGVFAHDLRARTEFTGSQEVWRARGGTLPRPWPEIEVTEIEPGDSIDGGDWRISSCSVPHAQPYLTCMGFAVDAGGKRFVYSGDAGPCDDLEALCQNADFLLHWCYRLSGGSNIPEIMLSTAPTPADIARMAERLKVKRLLLTHFRVGMDSEEGHAIARAELAEHFKGPAGIAEDLTSFVI